MLGDKQKILTGRSLIVLYTGLLAITFSHHHKIVYYSDNNKSFGLTDQANHNHYSYFYNGTNCPILQFSSTSYLSNSIPVFSTKFDSEFIVPEKVIKEPIIKLFSISKLRAPPSEFLS